jgi:ABC-type nitrate/sulfonate/bicarbonate transport system permease component
MTTSHQVAYSSKRLAPYAVESQAVPISTIALVLSQFFGRGIAAKGIIGALIIFLPKRASTMFGIRNGDPHLGYALNIMVGIIPHTALRASLGDRTQCPRDYSQ